jgi:triacylglycerol lipase
MQKAIITAGFLFLFWNALYAQPCTSGFRPLVLVHGFLGSGDNYAPLVRQLKASGYCPQQFFAYDWNSLARQDQTLALDAFVDSVLKVTGAKKINLIGHSAGGGVGYAYLNDSLRQQKVAHYAHIGSDAQKQPAGKDGGVPTLNLYSLGDMIVKSGEIPGATNIRFARFDHFEVVTADSTAQAVFRFFNPGQKIAAVKPPANKKPFPVTGKVVSLGENIPQAGAKISLQEVGQDGTPGKMVQQIMAGDKGQFSFASVEASKSYMVAVQPAAGRKVVYFFPSISPGEQLLYLRTLPASGMVAFLLSSLPADSAQTAIVIFSSQKAVIFGRDKLMVNNMALSTEEMAKPEKTAIAWFLYDADKNQKSDLTTVAAFNAMPFLRGVDMFLPALANKPVTLTWQDKTFFVPSIPSSEAVMIVVL